MRTWSIYWRLPFLPIKVSFLVAGRITKAKFFTIGEELISPAAKDICCEFSRVRKITNVPLSSNAIIKWIDEDIEAQMLERINELLHIHVQKYTTKTWTREIGISSGNVHKHIGIRKTQNLFRYETFYYLFEFKVFWHEERETQFLSMLTFLSEPHHVRNPLCKLLVCPRRAPKIDFLRPSPNFN